MLRKMEEHLLFLVKQVHTTCLQGPLTLSNDNNCHIVAANYELLRAGTISAYESALIALLRAQFFKLGIYIGTAAAGCIYINEVTHKQPIKI